MKKYETLYINDSTIKRKINAIRNERLKLGLRLQLQSGLRVKEIAELDREDITFTDYSILLHVKMGKADKNKRGIPKPRDVQVRPDKYLYDRLKKYIEGCTEERLFYTTATIKQMVKKYGIQTHDLRRINAQQRLADLKDKGMDRMKAKEIVRKQLGHSELKTTNIYLNRKKAMSLLGKKFKRRPDPEGPPDNEVII